MYVFVCIPRSLSESRELTVPSQYTEFQKQSVEINMEEKQTKRACLARSLSVNRELTVLCQYAEFQKQGVKINTEDKHREACSFFKRKPQGKYESTLTFTKGIRFTQKNFAG